MKKIGIVGGVAWLSTVDYYAEICRRSERWHLARDLNKAVAYLGADGDEESWSRFDGYHRAAIERLEASGTDFALMASNTPHHRFASIVRGIRIPVIGIFDVVAKQSARIGTRQVLILGTALIMTSPVFRGEFAKYGVEAAGPHDEAARRTSELITEMQLGRLEGAAERVAGIVQDLVRTAVQAQPVVCLACTELPLAFQKRRTLATFEYDGVLYFNSAAAHIDAAFDFAIDNPPVAISS